MHRAYIDAPDPTDQTRNNNRYTYCGDRMDDGEYDDASAKQSSLAVEREKERSPLLRF